MGVPVTSPNLARRKGNYGFDAPYVPILLGTIGLLLLVVGGIILAGHAPSVWPTICFIGGLWMLASAASYVYTTRAGKFAVWREILQGLHLRGDETVLDLGCGRGAVLLTVAKLLPRGQAVGLDLWRTADQSGNSMEVTRRNATLEGVAERVELHTGDMRALPFADGSFDLVVSSLAIHNIPDAMGRRQAVDEAVRVLKPGGRLLLADFRAVNEYRAELQQLAMAGVTLRTLDWRFWYGGPWTATKLVTATKPKPA